MTPFKLSSLVFTLIVLAVAIDLGDNRRLRKKKPTVCTVSRDQAEECAKNVTFIGSKGIKYPSNVEEAKQFCEWFRSTLDCMAKHRFCVSSFKRSLMFAFANLMKQANKDLCQPEMLPLITDNFQCMVGARGDPLIACLSRNTVRLRVIRDNVTRNDQFAAWCCSFAYFGECLKAWSDTECRPVIGGEVRDLLFSIGQKMSNQLFTCSDIYSSRQACLASLPEAAISFDSIDKVQNIAIPEESLLMLFFDIFGE
ncbi:hypothetical protein HDE_09187 [Halotydeus destructor]|nr:hypothetical protein HDE_09187 [Halotydeus destructor]